ncbi:DUF6771 family protein [Sphingobium sp. R-21]|uniref:DUF6771 family protein n=1 Tax=Sphingobium sp. R-21 TaxID=3404056 RepID=UPI003CEF6A57
MDEQALAIIAHVLDRAPQWLRHDLAAKHAATRQRAEETLAAMIADALGKGNAEAAKQA